MRFFEFFENYQVKKGLLQSCPTMMISVCKCTLGVVEHRQRKSGEGKQWAGGGLHLLLLKQPNLRIPSLFISHFCSVAAAAGSASAPPSAAAAGLDPIIFARAGADCICFYNFCDETWMRTDAGRRGEGEGGWLSNFRRSDTLDPLVMLKIYTLPKQNWLLFNFLDFRKSSFIRRFLFYIACSYSGFISTFCDLKLE